MNDIIHLEATATELHKDIQALKDEVAEAGGADAKPSTVAKAATTQDK